MLFVILLIVLILFVTLFVTFLVMLRRMDFEIFRNLCSKKVKRISKRRKLSCLTDLNLSNFDSEKLSVNQVIFGKKYIYIISNFLLKGFISGEEKDNSWVYFNNITKQTHYLDNLYALSDKNMQDFAGILQISPDPIVSICLVPNECDFKIGGTKNNKNIIVHYSSLTKAIRRLEKNDIGELDQNEIEEEFKLIKAKNEEGSR